MHNDKLEKIIEDKKAELKERELFEKFCDDKERAFMELEKSIEIRPLSEYSTTQLKAELRRRKGKK